MDIDALAREAVAALRPPPKLALSEWIERSIYLPSSLAAQPGRMRLFPPQVEIADAMGDAGIERVTLLKSARVGATQLMTAALGSFVQNDPCPVLAVLPSETDARHMVVSVIEPTFYESPTLRQALRAESTGRDTLFTRHFAGGSLTVVSAGSPRNLRARTARVLLLDEVDAYEVSAGTEGDPVSLAIRRTQTFADRKIVMASTLVDAETSRIAAAFEESDQRVFELPCPHCGDFHEITWAAISWPEGKPQETYKGTRRDKIWSLSDEAAFLAVAPPRVALGFMLGLWTGQRPGDVLRLTWDAYDGEAIRLPQGKTDVRIVRPVGAPLRTHLDNTPRVAKTICANTRRKPWTEDGFATEFHKAKKAAKIEGLSFSDLRGTAVTRLAIAGCTVPEIAAITGHTLARVESILDAHYLSRDSELARAAIRKREEHETKSVSPKHSPTLSKGSRSAPEKVV